MGMEGPRGKAPYAWIPSRLRSGYLDFLGECDHAARVVAGRERPSGLF